MSYVYKVDHTKVNYDNGKNSHKYIVIHYTANHTDRAWGNANYFRDVNRNSSAHLFVDDTEVYEVVSPDKIAWHVGRNYPRSDHKNLFGIVTNYNSIGIEMCSVNGKISESTFANTVALTRALMKQYGIPASNVCRHWDVCSKLCPGWTGWGAGFCDDSIWRRFKREIAAAADTGWKHDSKGWWYKNPDGTWPKGGWLKLDAWYYFDSSGYAYESKWLYKEGYYYYLKADCRMKTGWLYDGGEWYYLRPLSYNSKAPEGAMLTGWQKIDNEWYYLRPTNESGHPVGSAVSGMQKIDGQMYYFYPQTAGGHIANSMATGWVFTDGAWHYFNVDLNCQEKGSMLRNHWVLDRGNKYYLKDDGKMACGETLEISGDSRTFGDDGVLITE